MAYENLDVREQPGASELFARLHDRSVKVVLNTGYDRKTATLLVEKIGWSVGDSIDAIVTASDVENGRPAPDMIFRAMELTGVERAQAVVKIGDSIIDIDEGKNAGCGMTFGISTGAHSSDQLQTAKPTGVINHLCELLPRIASEQQV